MQSSPAQIQKYLAGVDYPVNKDEILAKAESEGAPPEVMDDLESLPDKEYGKPTDVTAEFVGEEIED